VNIGNDSTMDDLLFVAWAAGFFDGEGCIYAGHDQNNGYHIWRFIVLVSQTDPRPLEAMRERWGGTIAFKKRGQPHHKDQWSWRITGEPASVFIAEVLPLLRVKGEVASAALPVLFRTHRKGVRFKPHEIAERQAALEFIRATNRRGRRGETVA
jgi:hypothetical protein